MALNIKPLMGPEHPSPTHPEQIATGVQVAGKGADLVGKDDQSLGKSYTSDDLPKKETKDKLLKSRLLRVIGRY